MDIRSPSTRRAWLPLLLLLAIILLLWPRTRPGLKAVAPPAMRVGVAVHPSRLENPAYAALVAREFNSVIPEVVLKHEWIHPCPPAWLIAQNPTVSEWVAGLDEATIERPARNCKLEPEEWNWQPMDKVVRWASEHHIGVWMHPLVWHSQNAPWLVAPTVQLTPAETDRVMREHIEGVIAHYCALEGGQIIYAYNVVNEAVGDGGGLYEGGPWVKSGEDYVVRAFGYARTALEQHCPRRKIALFYNDHNFEFGPILYDGAGQPSNRAAGVHALMRALHEAGVVDGLGLQSHLRLYQGGEAPAWGYAPPRSPVVMRRLMDRFSQDFGVEIHVSELDVSLRRWRGSCMPDAPRPTFGGGDCPIPIPNATVRDTLWQQQAAWYRSVAQACLGAQRCTGLQSWGVADEQSWLAPFTPSMFHTCGRRWTNFITSYPVFCPKPAYDALWEVLAGATAARTASGPAGQPGRRAPQR